jgi:hypothetical protein
MSILGMKVIVSPNMTRMVEDHFPHVRKMVFDRLTGRNARRLKMGHPQRIKYVKREVDAFMHGDTLIVGPETYARLLKEVRA